MSDEQIHTPEEWCEKTGVCIIDPDGWRGTSGRPWDDAITLEEFKQRALWCTLSGGVSPLDI
jgi:hypothetical protein